MTTEIGEVVTGPGNVFVAMQAVMTEIGAVGKNLKNAQAGYNARSIDDVLDAVHGPMAAHGVFPVPEVLDAQYEDVLVGRNQTPMRQATLKVAYTFYGQDGSSVRAVGMGEALDSGDKATNKAMSAAFKYVLIQTFVIPVSMPDADGETVERAQPASVQVPLPEGEREQVRVALAARDDLEVLKSAWKTWGLPKIDGLTVDDRDRVSAFLNQHQVTVPALEAPLAVEDGGPTDVTLDQLEGVCATCGRSDGTHEDGCDETPF